MTVGTARGPASARTTGTAAPRPAAPAVTRIAVRQVLRGTAVVTLVCGGLVAVVVTQYRGLDEAIGLSSLSSLADNPAIRTLFGRADALDDPGGFTVWRTGTLVAVLVGTWAVLTATRLTRGEEEAGRWELLLAGRLPLRALVLRTLAVVLAAAMLPGVGVALGLLLAGTATTGAVLYGAAVAGVGLTGAALGVLAAQLMPERRAASGLATVVFMAGLLARMVADGVPAFSWLHWSRRSGCSAAPRPSPRTGSSRSPSSPRSRRCSGWRRWRWRAGGTSAPAGWPRASTGARRAGCCARSQVSPSTAPAGRWAPGGPPSARTSCSSACSRRR
jgi:ABC-2 type transport system permease protein